MIKFKIKNRTIDKYQKPFIVAELSANHGNSLSIALKSISEAKKMEQMLLRFKLIQLTL